MGEYDKAESLYLQALKIREKKLNDNHSHLIQNISDLACLYLLMQEPEKAESFKKKLHQDKLKNYKEIKFWMESKSKNIRIARFSNNETFEENLRSKNLKNILKNLKMGRNDPCPCASSKKYKKCCLIE